jgi:hypothetical protein
VSRRSVRRSPNMELLRAQIGHEPIGGELAVTSGNVIRELAEVEVVSFQLRHERLLVVSSRHRQMGDHLSNPPALAQRRHRPSRRPTEQPARRRAPGTGRQRRAADPHPRSSKLQSTAPRENWASRGLHPGRRDADSTMGSRATESGPSPQGRGPAERFPAGGPPRRARRGNCGAKRGQ